MYQFRDAYTESSSSLISQVRRPRLSFSPSRKSMHAYKMQAMKITLSAQLSVSNVMSVRVASSCWVTDFSFIRPMIRFRTLPAEQISIFHKHSLPYPHYIKENKRKKEFPIYHDRKADFWRMLLAFLKFYGFAGTCFLQLHRILAVCTDF